MNQMTRIVAAPAEGYAARFTTAEFIDMADRGAFEGLRLELVNGELTRMQQPRSSHAIRQAQLVIRLSSVVGEKRVTGDVGIALDEDTLLGCDAAVLREPVNDNRMLAPADLMLVIEVSETTLSRDLDMKRRKYAEAGIPLYWVVNGARSVVHVHAEPVDGEYVDIHTVRFGQPLAVPGTDATITLD